MTDPLLSLEDVHASYGESHILRGVSMEVSPGEVVSLVGRNGAGKTTTLRSIVGVLEPTRGTVTFDGEDVTHLPDHERVQRGIQYVPEDRQAFPDLTVDENLRMGDLRSGGEGIYTIDEVYDVFPRLRERQSQSASHLSGGEQQMLVIARALVGETELLLLDEPSEGLAPQIVRDVLDVIDRIRDEGVTILLVEQNVHAAMETADRHYVIDRGQIVFEGDTAALEGDREVQEKHLGVGATLDEPQD
ncbi:ABC transporter ATP-binding protein [Halostella sp. PRR32]|uniref:ABC transporter ATP-binding protein n=1 Tax=Halostella sp. PRR32 TaxID=3098147 RepID=UPI002B1E0FCF|nr:ABC transporter ATP-binding protein [Halostella sp. PRR32]